MPTTARVARFLPYSLLLPHTDVLVTNGGYEVLQALSYGVPVAVAGGTEEKPDVAARVAWSGAGIDLRTGRPTDDKLGTAVRTVLDDPSYAGAAARLQVEFAAHSPYNDVAAAVEGLLQDRTGTAAPR